MAEFDNNMTGALFPREKETEKHPDFSGPLEINGVKYSVSAWKNVAGSGLEYLSLKVREWQDKAPATGEAAAPAPEKKKPGRPKKATGALFSE